MADKYLNITGITYLWNKIKSTFVAKETGKGLSTNDYTTAEKTKLSGIEAGANNYSLPTASASILGGIKVGSNLSIDGDGVLSATGGSGASEIMVINASADCVHGATVTLTGTIPTEAELYSAIQGNKLIILKLTNTGISETYKWVTLTATIWDLSSGYLMFSGHISGYDVGCSILLTGSGLSCTSLDIITNS